MRKLIGLIIVTSNMQAMETYKKPQALVELAAQKIAHIILSHNHGNRSQCGTLLAGLIAHIGELSLRVGQAIVKLQPDIICPILNN